VADPPPNARDPAGPPEDPFRAPAEDDPERAGRRARRELRRQAFGTRLLTTFAVVLTVVSALVFLLAGVMIHDTTQRALEGELARHLEDVADLTAAELTAYGDWLEQARAGDEPARRGLAELLRESKPEGGTGDLVLFAPSGAAGADALEVVASTRAPERREGERSRLYADRVAIERAIATGEATASAIYTFAEGDAEAVPLMAGYAPVLGPEGEVLALVGVELPADYREATAEVLWRFVILGVCAGAIVLATAVLLVRQRVHVPLYRLIRAMRGAEDGAPQPAKVRWPDEIGALTEHYNRMVERLAAKDRELRELYDRTRERAVYLQGYSNCLVAGVPSGVVAIDAEGRVRVWNPPAARILGLEGTLDAPVREVLGAEHALTRALEAAVERGSVTEQALVVLDESGEHDDLATDRQRLVELGCAPFYGEDGELLGAAALVNDRTELEQLRRAASRNERLAAIGNLGAGLAHEIKNPLGAISGFAELIERKEGQDAARLAGRLRHEVDELNRFLQLFLAFARDDQIRREPTDLDEVVRRGVAQALQEALEDDAVEGALAGDAVDLPEGGELRIELELGGLPTLAVDGTLLRAAFANLARNALQVMPGGGVLAIRTTSAGDHALVRVRDTGPGIPVEERERVFDALYTTRAEGTGLGLAIVHKTVVAHGGKVSVRDAPGGGAEVLVWLPVVGAPRPEAEAPAAAGAVPAGERE